MNEVAPEVAAEVTAGLRTTQRRLEAACSRAGRPPTSVQLIAVSKLKPAGLVWAAHQAGQLDFGENYAQELRDKAAQLQLTPPIRWHAIGPLQTNKVKYVAKVASSFHALERLEVAQELSRRREGAPLECFVEVNIGQEASKGGVQPDQLERFLEPVRAIAGITVVGLMCMPPLAGDPELSRPYFRHLRALAERAGLQRLSMGTTDDFEVAIEEGATSVRVGSAIFGARPARNQLKET